jgi:hypothetical protein
MVRPQPSEVILFIFSTSCACQIQTSKGETLITNDGATILRSIQALHPAAKMVHLMGMRVAITSLYLCFSSLTFRLRKTLRQVMVQPRL